MIDDLRARVHNGMDAVRAGVNRVGAYRVLFVVGLLLGAAVFGASGAVVSWLSNPVSQSGTVTYGAADGPDVTFTGDYNFTGVSVWSDNNTITWQSNQGNITLSSPDTTKVTVDQIQGSETKLSNLSVSNATLTIDAVDRNQKIAVHGGTETLNFRQVDTSTGADGEEDLYYAGSSGQTEITIYGLSSDTTVAAIDRGTDDVLDASTTNSNGVVTFTMPNSQHSVDIQTYDANPPQVDGDSATPNKSATVSGEPVTLAVNISDSDFPNDQLEVNFTVNGNVVDTQTVTSDGRVSYTLSDSETPVAGDHSWGVTATDKFDQTTRKEFELLMPSKLVVKNVSSGNLVDNAAAEVTFTGSDTVIQRDASDGTANLSGLSTTEQFVARVEADGYITRSTVIQSLVSQQTVYLLHENASAAEIVWHLDDATGRFQGNGAQLIVERPITENNTTRYQAVAGGDFGSTNTVSTVLENGVTYRLKVRNDDGAMRVLGSYTVSGPAEETLPIGDVNITIPDDSSPAFNAQLKTEDGQRVVRLQYRDPQDETESLQIEIVRADNESKVLVENTTNVGPYGSYTETVPVPSGAPDDVAYKVRYHANRGNQEDEGGTVFVGDVPEIAQNWNIDPQVLSLAGYIAILAMTGLVVPWRPSLAPLTGSLTAITLTIFGVVSIPALFLGLGGTTSILLAFAGRQTT